MLLWELKTKRKRHNDIYLHIRIVSNASNNKAKLTCTGLSKSIDKDSNPFSDFKIVGPMPLLPFIICHTLVKVAASVLSRQGKSLSIYYQQSYLSRLWYIIATIILRPGASVRQKAYKHTLPIQSKNLFSTIRSYGNSSRNKPFYTANYVMACFTSSTSLRQKKR